VAEHGVEPTDIKALKDYLPEVPTIPLRIVENAKDWLVGGDNALKEKNEEEAFIYYLAPSSQAGGQKRAFPVLVKDKGNYRAGDTIGDGTETPGS